VAALADLSLTVPRGGIDGFLGPNGAGKTTTIRLLMGFIRPSAGVALVNGHDAWRAGVAARRDLGYLVGAEALYPEMTGRALLDHAAGLSGRAPALRPLLLEALELGERDLGRRLRTYSKGMRQKLALTAAAQHDPALLILDEPTDGLDPLIQRAFEEVLRGLRDRGRTIFMSSHDLAEVERTCERVAVVRGGRLIAEETVAGLKRRQRRTARVVFAGQAPAAELGRLPGVAVLGRDQEGRRVELAIGAEIGPLLRFLGEREVVDLLLPPPSLDDVFLGFYDQTGGANGREDGGEELAGVVGGARGRAGR
jgi:ABC-2 type transport system ATP-binding protein